MEKCTCCGESNEDSFGLLLINDVWNKQSYGFVCFSCGASTAFFTKLETLLDQLPVTYSPDEYRGLLTEYLEGKLSLDTCKYCGCKNSKNKEFGLKYDPHLWTFQVWCFACGATSRKGFFLEDVLISWEDDLLASPWGKKPNWIPRKTT